MTEAVDNKLPWQGLLRAADIVRLKDSVPSFLICPAYTGRFGAADEAGVVKIMGSGTDFYYAKKILTRWYAKASEGSEKVKWWQSAVEKKGIQAVTSHDILNGLSHDRWTQYVARYNREVASHHQRAYHARKKAAVIKAKQDSHRAARELLGLAGQPSNETGSSGGGRDGASGSKK